MQKLYFLKYLDLTKYPKIEIIEELLNKIKLKKRILFSL